MDEDGDVMDECAAAMVLMHLSCSPHSPRWEGKRKNDNNIILLWIYRMNCSRVVIVRGSIHDQLMTWHGHQLTGRPWTDVYLHRP